MRYLFLLIVLCSCPSTVDIDNNGNVIGNPGTKAQQVSCLSAETNLLKLQCKDHEGLIIGAANRKGETFHITCQQLITNKIKVNTECLTLAKTCLDVAKCDEGVK